MTQPSNPTRPPQTPEAAATRPLSVLSERYGCPEEFETYRVSDGLSGEPGFFRFGKEAICFGQCSSGAPARNLAEPLHDASLHTVSNGAAITLPFDPSQIIQNLRYEQYTAKVRSNGGSGLLSKNPVRLLYYGVRPFLPVAVRKYFQRAYLRGWESIPFPRWPVDMSVEFLLERLLALAMKSRNVTRMPFIWFWPEGAPSCTLVTHDVETLAGVQFCGQLMDLNDAYGIKTSFQVIPENRYTVEPAFLEGIRKRGFEVNIHDLNHDGQLFSDLAVFEQRAPQIEAYRLNFGVQGFRSAVLYRNASWIERLDFSYDMSIPNVGHLDPQRGGCCTVMPFFVGKLIELPVTAIQDYSLFHILKDFSIRRWEEQIRLIREKHGLISFIVHPDYIIQETPRRVYAELLGHLSEMRSRGETWIALPNQVADWWRKRRAMQLVRHADGWRIQGEGAERARIAYAVLQDEKLTYELAPASFPSQEESHGRGTGHSA